jgi:hypothetical protein
MIQNGTFFLLSDKVKTADTDQYAETVFPIQPTLAHVVCILVFPRNGKLIIVMLRDHIVLCRTIILNLFIILFAVCRDGIPNSANTCSCGLSIPSEKMGKILID